MKNIQKVDAGRLLLQKVSISNKGYSFLTFYSSKNPEQNVSWFNTKLSSTTVFNIYDNNMLNITCSVKDHVTLKTRLKLMKIQLFSFTGINDIYKNIYI